jgi:hypothetical protein
MVLVGYANVAQRIRTDPIGLKKQPCTIWCYAHQYFVKKVELLLSVLTKQKEKMDTRKLWEVMNMPITLVLVFGCVQIHQIVQIKCVQFDK